MVHLKSSDHPALKSTGLSFVHQPASFRRPALSEPSTLVGGMKKRAGGRS